MMLVCRIIRVRRWCMRDAECNTEETDSRCSRSEPWQRRKDFIVWKYDFSGHVRELKKKSDI
jgi:hypothetical protein